MRILILGAGGLLGHRLFLELSKHHEVWGTWSGGWFPKGFQKDRFAFLKAPVEPYLGLKPLFADTRPDVVINCIAVIRPDKRFVLDAIQVNAEFPYELMYATHEHNSRLIHFSTDGVFSGKKGDYDEDDTPDATDVYGMTKRLGEISDKPHVLTLRCCPVGRELPLSAKRSLVEWFLAQSGTVKGYTNAWFTGLTTHEIAHVLNTHVLPRTDLHGIYHVSGAPISKYAFLNQLKYLSEHDVEIVPDNTVDIDRSLSSNRFFKETGYVSSTWNSMIEEMAADNALYEGEHAHI